MKGHVDAAINESTSRSIGRDALVVEGLTGFGEGPRRAAIAARLTPLVGEFVGVGPQEAVVREARDLDPALLSGIVQQPGREADLKQVSCPAGLETIDVLVNVSPKGRVGPHDRLDVAHQRDEFTVVDQFVGAPRYVRSRTRGIAPTGPYADGRGANRLGDRVGLDEGDTGITVGT